MKSTASIEEEKLPILSLKKFGLLATFFIAAPVLLLFCVLYVSFLSTQKGHTAVLGASTGIAYAAIPASENALTGSVEQKDGRVAAVADFFHRYNSPLEPYAATVVAAADTYNIDFRLIPAIAMQESQLCLKAPKDSYNCWGFGIYDKKVIKFNSYTEAINTVSKTLAQNYKSQGLDTPEEIMSKYTPSSSGTWANSVNYFFNQLQ